MGKGTHMWFVFCFFCDTGSIIMIAYYNGLSCIKAHTQECALFLVMRLVCCIND